MNHVAARGAAALVLAATVLGSVGHAQPGVPDKVIVRDKKANKERTEDGELKVTAAQYEILAPGSKKPIPVNMADIVRVVPGDASLPGLDRDKEVRPADLLEGNREFAKALLTYQDVRKRLAAPQEKTRKFLDFKIATLTARVADETPYEDGWKGRAEEAVGLLTKYLIANPSGWELWPAASTLARLQTELGQLPEAAATWAKLAARDDSVPVLMRQEALLREIDCYVRAGSSDAAGKIEKFKPDPGPIADRLKLYQIAAKKLGDGDHLGGVSEIEAEVAKADKNPAVRATGYSLIGELYLAAKKPREAMWALLWVEVVYNQDRDEVLKALTRLVTVFEAQGDEERAKAYREKLRRYRAAL